MPVFTMVIVKLHHKFSTTGFKQTVPFYTGIQPMLKYHRECIHLSNLWLNPLHSIIFEYPLHVVYLNKNEGKGLTYTSYKEQFELYSEIHCLTAVNRVRSYLQEKI